MNVSVLITQWEDWVGARQRCSYLAKYRIWISYTNRPSSKNLTLKRSHRKTGVCHVQLALAALLAWHLTAVQSYTHSLVSYLVFDKTKKKKISLVRVFSS